MNCGRTCHELGGEDMGASLCYQLESGTYGVFAAKDEAGYSIENQRPGEKVELTGDLSE